MKNIPLLFITLSLLCLCSCQTKTEQTTATYDISLKEAKKITLPIDENTYYLSKSMFQFEEDNKEYLSFGNFEKNQYEIILYDIEKEDIHKRIPLMKEGPNGVNGIIGLKPYDGSKSFLCFQHNSFRFSIIDGEGNLLKQFSTAPQDKKFMMSIDGISYFHYPSFVIDSVIHFHQGPQYLGSRERGIKQEDWKEFHMFASLNFRNGKIDWLLNFPSIFDHDVKNPAGGHGFSYDYNYKENRLVCSFTGYDSLMVTDDLQHIRWYDGKSRYLKTMRPILPEANLGVQALVDMKEAPQYLHIMYDKYRDLYYRFAEHPCELGPNEAFMNDPKAREFSVIIFDKDFNIIGETKFPGNKYLYKMSFVGRDGLYISENNEANPEFDEDKLVFACFKLEDLKE